MKELKSLYNGIMNDYSVQKYSMGWKNIISKIEKRYKVIPKTNEIFEDRIIFDALNVSKGALYKAIESFIVELDINKETLRCKYKK